MKKNLAQNTAVQKHCSQKRNVVALKVFVTLEEKILIENRVGDLKSISNFFRHLAGLQPNITGRKPNQISAVSMSLDDEIKAALDRAFGQTSNSL